MPVKFLVLWGGGGYFVFFLGGGEVPILILWLRAFVRKMLFSAICEPNLLEHLVIQEVTWDWLVLHQPSVVAH